MGNKKIHIDIEKKERIIWSWVKQMLALQDSSFEKLRRIYGGYNPNYARVKHHPFPKYEAIIARSIGLEPWDIWPHRYRADHTPLGCSNLYHPDEFYAKRIIRKSKKSMANIGGGNSHETQG